MVQTKHLLIVTYIVWTRRSRIEETLCMGMPDNARRCREVEESLPYQAPLAEGERVGVEQRATCLGTWVPRQLLRAMLFLGGGPLMEVFLEADILNLFGRIVGVVKERRRPLDSATYAT